MQIDLAIFNAIHGLAGKWSLLDYLGIFCAVYLGYVLLFVLLCFLLINGKKYWRMVAESVAAALFVRFVLVNFIRMLRFRPRPFTYENFNALIPYDYDKTSFPSGHASFYFALSAIIYAYNKKAGMFFFAASFLISLGRVFVGVHWPSDIVVGAVLGVVIGWLLNRVFKKLFLPVDNSVAQS